MPSWQARVMNICTRTMVKPMMRFGSIRQMQLMGGFIQDREIPSAPQGMTLRRVTSHGYEGDWIQVAGKRPRKVILYFPGGGFVVRSGAQHREFLAKICRTARAKALIIHYRLAPEVPFPGGLEDCLAAYHHLLQQGIKPENVSIVGDSAGGGLVLSTLLALRDEGTPLPANAVVLSPLADLTHTVASRKFNNRKDPLLLTSQLAMMRQAYIGAALPEDRHLSPVLADFDGLPPILGQVGSTEILLSDTVDAAAQARKAGVPFYLEIWREMPHVFPVIGVLPESAAAIERIAEFVINSELDELPKKYGSSDFIEKGLHWGLHWGQVLNCEFWPPSPFRNSQFET